MRLARPRGQSREVPVNPDYDDDLLRNVDPFLKDDGVSHERQDRQTSSDQSTISTATGSFGQTLDEAAWTSGVIREAHEGRKTPDEVLTILPSQQLEQIPVDAAQDIPLGRVFGRPGMVGRSRQPSSGKVPSNAQSRLDAIYRRLDCRMGRYNPE